MKVTGPSNYHTRILLRKLWKTKRKIWKRVSEIIGKPRRNLSEINLFRLNKITKNDEIVVVPGKILGSGALDHSITIGALKVSKIAKEKLEKTQCTILSIEELLEKYPTGSGVRIIT